MPNESESSNDLLVMPTENLSTHNKQQKENDQDVTKMKTTLKNKNNEIQHLQ